MFYIDTWPIRIIVKAPCGIENIQGLDSDGSVTVRVDDEATLIFKLGNDDRDISWKVKCGRLLSTTLSNTPSFLPNIIDDDKLVIKPTEEHHIGTYVVGAK